MAYPFTGLDRAQRGELATDRESTKRAERWLALFDRFDEIVLPDTEFISRTGELYDPVCVAWKELKSGRSGALWCDEFGLAPPHAHGKNVLVVGFTAAEPEFYRSVGWPFDMAFLDLRVEGIQQTNIAYSRDDPRRQKLPRSLISFLRANNIHDGDEAHKEVMRSRILRGFPFNRKERRLILKYCMGDVLLLEKLLEVLGPRIRNLNQALLRGEYVKLTAEMFAVGMPADPWAAPMLREPETRQAVRLRAVSDTKLTHGLYTGPTLTQAMVKAFLVKHQIKEEDWRKTKTGKLGTANRDLERLEKQFPGLPDAGKTIGQVKEWQLFAGSDGRYRTPIWGYSTISSRAAPNGAAFPFSTPAWGRFTLMPTEGTMLAYLDFSGMEFGVAAGRSQAPQMLADYQREPYLVLPIEAGLLPRGTTKLTHPKIRDEWKPMILAVQYGGGAALLAHRLKISSRQAQRVVILHHERYAEYWEWSDRQLQRAFDAGELVTPDGWRCGVNSNTPTFTARNWLIQALSQAIFRYASLMMHRLGIRICCPVHDAVMLEASIDDIERVVALAVHCLERASQRFLCGLTLRVDVKLIRPGERFTDPRGEDTWAFVERTLLELEEGRRNAVR